MCPCLVIFFQSLYKTTWHLTFHLMSGNPKKRPKLSIQTNQSSSQPHSIRDKLPCVDQWPENLEQDTIAQRYFDTNIRPNRFVYASIILKSNDTYSTLNELKLTGAFSSSNGRQALVDIIGNVRDAGEYRAPCCSDDLLDTLERYACYAFSIEDDKLSVGCGTIPLENAPCKRRRVLIDCIA